MRRRDRPTRAEEIENARHFDEIERARARRISRITHATPAPLAWWIRLAWTLRAENRGELTRDQLLTAAGRMNVIVEDRIGLLAQIAIDRTAPRRPSN